MYAGFRGAGHAEAGQPGRSPWMSRIETGDGVVREIHASTFADQVPLLLIDLTASDLVKMAAKRVHDRRFRSPRHGTGAPQCARHETLLAKATGYDYIKVQLQTHALKRPMAPDSLPRSGSEHWQMLDHLRRISMPTSGGVDRPFGLEGAARNATATIPAKK